MFGLSRSELLDEIATRQRRVAVEEAALATAVAALDAIGASDDPVTTAAVVANRCRVPKARAKLLLTVGRAVRQMTDAAEAFEAGELTLDHLRLLAAAQRRCPKAFAKAEAELVHEGCTLRFDVFRRRVQYFVQLADEDEADEDAASVHSRRSLHASRTFEDAVRVDGWMDPVGGSIWLNELHRLEQLEFEADWRAAREQLGDGATAADLARTPAQRRHDALIEMAKRSAAMPADAKQGRYLLSVLVGYETMHGRVCELADGTVLTPGQLLPLLTNADVERAVFGPDSRVIDLGRRARLFVGGTRRAVQLSELECGEETCDVRFERCEVDHIERWEHGGRTDRANGRLRCPQHHEGRRRRRPPP